MTFTGSWSKKQIAGYSCWLYEIHTWSISQDLVNRQWPSLAGLNQLVCCVIDITYKLCTSWCLQQNWKLKCVHMELCHGDILSMFTRSWTKYHDFTSWYTFLVLEVLNMEHFSQLNIVNIHDQSLSGKLTSLNYFIMYVQGYTQKGTDVCSRRRKLKCVWNFVWWRYFINVHKILNKVSFHWIGYSTLSLRGPQHGEFVTNVVNIQWLS